MNVEAYRKSIRRRVRVMELLGIAYVVVMIAIHVLWGGRVDAAEEALAWDGVVEGFVWGAVTAVVACFALIVPRYVKALNDEQALRRLWNKEHDERMQAIKARAGAPMLLYTSVAMIAVALLIGPWNMMAAMTLMLAATAQILACAVTKLICMRMM